MRTEKLQTAVTTTDNAPLDLYATIYHPDKNPSGIIFFCLPGGGASCEFFDLGQYENTDYSFASRMTALGHMVITMDHPGTATNPVAEGHPFLTPQKSSNYLAQAVTNFMQQIDGDTARMIGVGHSMGGMMTVLMQARHNIFDGIVLLGSSAGGLDWGLDDFEKTYIDKPQAIERDLEKLVIRKFGSHFMQATVGPSGKSITFGGATPELTQRLRDISIPLYGAGGMMSMIRGSFLAEAQSIDIPIFFAFGDHDIGVPPEKAVADFKGSHATEVHILENSGHNSLAFPAIGKFCDNLDRWSRTI